MRRTFLILLSAVMMLLLLFGCGDDTPPPFQQFCSLHADGTNLINQDNSLQVPDLGKPFYVSDEVIFHLGTKLVKQNLDTGSVIQLSPNGLPISDNNYLAIDRQNQMLYFAAANAIYRVGFDGQNPLKLSPDDSGIYSAPAL
ncbi:MAG: hypothetical protein PHO32_08355, partial [Candidatus Cloacimonetes bacterium]|nr:hypothetical protein [Candidatus Cloacimonadota bacterium]